MTGLLTLEQRTELVKLSGIIDKDAARRSSHRDDRLSAQPASYERVPPGCPLTNRQYETVVLLCVGLSHKEIAGRMKVKRGTVTHHAHAAYERLGVIRGRSEAVVLMKDSGWLGALPRGPRQGEGPLTLPQRVYCYYFDQLAADPSPRNASLVEVASIMLLGEHCLAPDRPPARPDMDTLLLRMALGATRAIP